MEFFFANSQTPLCGQSIRIKIKRYIWVNPKNCTFLISHHCAYLPTYFTWTIINDSLCIKTKNQIWYTECVILPIKKGFRNYFHNITTALLSSYVHSTVFKNKLLTKVDAQTNGWHYENHCIKRLSHLWQFWSIS